LLAVENFINVNWKSEFPDYPLTAADFKKPPAVMGALFQLFDRIGIDRDAIVGVSVKPIYLSTYLCNKTLLPNKRATNKKWSISVLFQKYCFYSVTGVT
jgi:hypothetical protein